MTKKILSVGDVKVIKSLYKHLLVMSSRFDKYPQSKTLIYRRTSGSNLSHENYGSIYYSYLLDSILSTKGSLYQPISDISLKKLVKKEFRRKEINSISVAGRIDVAFAASRKLSSLWNVFNSIDDDNEDDDDVDINKLEEIAIDIDAESNKNNIENINNEINANKISNSIIKGRDKYSRETIVSNILKSNNTNDTKEDTGNDDDIITASSTINLKPGVLLVAHPMIHGALHRKSSIYLII
jgi:hypothetical protein